MNYQKIITYIILCFFFFPLNATSQDSLKGVDAENIEIDKSLPDKKIKKKKKEKPKKLNKEEKEIAKAEKAMWVAHLLRDRKSEFKIKDLDVRQDKVPVLLVPRGNDFRPLVKLNFKYPKEGWELFDVDGNKLRKVGESEYLLYAYLRSRISTIDLYSIGPKREKQHETFYVFAPEARAYKSFSPFDAFSFTIGHSYLKFKQSSFGSYAAHSLLVGAKYLSPESGKKLGFLGEVSSSIYTYDSSPIDRSSNFLEARLAGSYAIKIFKNPVFRSRLMLGAYNANLYSRGRGLGFSGLLGPNIGLRTDFYKSVKNSFSADINYTAYDYSDPLGERSFKLSMEWSRNYNNLRRGTMGLSLANHEFTDQGDELTANHVAGYFSMSF